MARSARMTSLFVTLLLLFSEQAVCAQNKVITAPVAHRFAERLSDLGLIPRDAKEPIYRSNSKYKGGFQYQYKPDRYGVPVNLYRSDNGNKRWEAGKQRDIIYKSAGVSVEFSSYSPKTYKHKSLEKYAKENSTKDKKYTSSLGSPPEVNDVDYVYQGRSDFHAGRRAGADVERLLEYRSHFLEFTGIIYGAPHASDIAKLHKYSGAVKTTSLIRFRYDYKTFGQSVEAGLLVKLTVFNGINHPSRKLINPDQIEDAVFWAIAEVLGKPEIATIPDGRDTPDSNATLPDGSVAMTAPVTEQPAALVSLPPQPATSPTGGVYGEAFEILSALEKTKFGLLGLRAQLRALSVSVREERQWLQNAKSSLQVMAGSPHSQFYRDAIAESEKKIAGLLQETESLLQLGNAQWELLQTKLEQTIAKTSDNAMLQKELSLWRGSIAKLQQVSKLEMLLVAGRTDEFKAKLPAALKDPDLNERALELQATGMLDEGKYAEALYALRISTKKYPANPTLELIMSNVEINYLKLISAKTFDEGDRLRDAWNEYMVGSEDSFLMQTVTGGVKRGLHRLVGTAGFRETLVKERISLAATQQNGVELMWRLRQKGLSFESIKQLQTENLRNQLVAMAPNKSPPSDDALEEMMLSIMTAFTHPDVANLIADNRRLMQVDSQENYLGSDLMETEGALYAAESIMDFTSIKNVLMVFGPMAKVRGVGAVARLAQRFGLGGAARAATLESGAALTAQEWIYARPSLQALSQSIGNTRAGQTLFQGRHAIRGLRYDSSLPVRWSTGSALFGTEVIANWILAEGLGKVGNAIGGEYGQMAGEIGSSFIGVPVSGSVSQLQERWQKSMSQIQKAKRSWKSAEAVLRQVRAPIREATETIAAGRKLSQPQIATLSAAVEQLDDLAVSSTSTSATVRARPKPNSTAPTLANSTTANSSTLVQATTDTASETGNNVLATLTDEMKTLSANARAAVAGQTDEAIATSAAATTLQRKAEGLASISDEAERVLTGTLNDLKRKSRKVTNNLDTFVPGSAAAKNSVPSVPKSPQKLTGAAAYDDLVQSAEAAMKNGEFDKATGLLHTASRHPKSTDAIETLLSEANAASQMAKINARKATSSSATMKKLAAEADEAMKPFSENQRHLIKKMPRKEMVALDGAGDALRINDPSGKAIAVWKPASRVALDGLSEEGQMIAEVLTSQLGRKLGLRVPHAEPHVLEGRAGVLIRWIPKTTDLSKFKPGAKAAFKRQVASFRPMQIMTGNYDIHHGNFKVDSAGRVWAIDAGMAYLKSPKPEDLVHMIRQHSGGKFGMNGDASHAVNSARWLRDLYNYTADAPKFSASHKPVRRLNELISGADLQNAAKKLQGLSDSKLRAVVSDVMQSAPKSKSETPEIVSTLLERRDAMATLLNEHWPGAMP